MEKPIISQYERQFLSKLRFVAFMLGFASCFITLVYQGQRTTSVNTLSGMKRIHQNISPENLYFPTSRQIWQWVLSQADRDKMNIVLGGSSLINGVGQPAGSTLSEKLQAKLGNGYVVMNLAMRGGSLAGQGLYMAEKLKREKYRVIYIADLEVNMDAPPLGRQQYLYFDYDSYFNGFLTDWQPRKEHARLLFEAHDVNKAGDKISIIGHRVDGGLGAMINSQLAFTEFWNMVGWEYVFTVYSKLTPNNFWHARKMLPDPQIDLPQSMRYLRFENDLELSRKLSEPINVGRWQSLEKSWKDAIPDDFKRNTIIVLCEKSPAHRHLLPKELQDERRNKQLNAEKILGSLGYSAEYLCDDFLRDDYIDIVHLSIQGAEKLASRLVEPIKAVEFMMMEH